ncbi:MAG: caspase family protein [Candidatus Woesearchaeota archaeon]|nr:caspase family protein [Candidatus Woesearchaeota archaeon]
MRNAFLRIAAVSGLVGALALSNNFGQIAALSIEERIERLESAEIMHSEKDKYAVILNGDPSELHFYNCSTSHSSLENMGFCKDNIFTLSEKPDSYFEEQDFSAFSGTKENFQRVSDLLSQITDDNDIVLFYLTGHGDRMGGRSALVLKDDYLFDIELKECIDKIDSRITIVVADQCYSGGFADELKNSSKSVIAISDTDAVYQTDCKVFSDSFWKAFSGTSADSNSDSKVSLREAYDFAIEKHSVFLRPFTGLAHGSYYFSGDIKDIFLGEN